MMRSFGASRLRISCAVVCAACSQESVRRCCTSAQMRSTLGDNASWHGSRPPTPRYDVWAIAAPNLGPLARWHPIFGSVSLVPSEVEEHRRPVPQILVLHVVHQTRTRSDLFYQRYSRTPKLTKPFISSSRRSFRRKLRVGLPYDRTAHECCPSERTYTAPNSAKPCCCRVSRIGKEAHPDVTARPWSNSRRRRHSQPSILPLGLLAAVASVQQTGYRD
ncbi:hypothetical protein C8Q77DRAFT_912673 [Trametes polyzona]|nr:hypothetical protein C8Q77DRAFT_912673 [Trametes polyzona]